MERTNKAAGGLLGRRRECAHLDDLLAGAVEGHSAALVLHGEAGIGKTALMDYARDRASAYRVARVTGVEAEVELPFGGLHQLCAPFRDRLHELPDPQQTALEAAFGLTG
jgi:predicted ATPase